MLNIRVELRAPSRPESSLESLRKSEDPVGDADEDQAEEHEPDGERGISPSEAIEAFALADRRQNVRQLGSGGWRHRQGPGCRRLVQ